MVDIQPATAGNRRGKKAEEEEEEEDRRWKKPQDENIMACRVT